jgi:Rrf2 family cysteine metabolism transcriptional repressor
MFSKTNSTNRMYLTCYNPSRIIGLDCDTSWISTEVRKLSFSLSTKGHYAVLLMYELARSEDDFVSLAEISAAQKLSQGYLEQIVIPLREHGLVQGKRGFGGGYKLARPADRITVGEIVKVAEGPVAPVKCMHDDFSDYDCPEDCRARLVWEKVGNAIEGVLHSITLHDLVEGAAHTGKKEDTDHE